MKRVMRGDRIEFPHGYTTKEGFIQAHAIVTRTGVFKYLNTDGSIRRELRHPDDVFKQESLDTLRMIPVTINHPSELVDSENASRYSVGSTGDNYNIDGKFIMSSLAVHKQDGVDAIENGKSQLSLGYEITPIEEVGEYNGERYDIRQTEIEYNHLAIVDLARAGKEASVKMDSGSEFSVSNDIIKQVSKNDDTNTPNNKPKEITMKIAVIDGVAVQVEDAEESKLLKAVSAITQKVTDAENATSALQAKLDALEVDKKKVDAELVEAKSDSVMQGKITARVDLESKARKVVGDEIDFSGKTDMEIKKMVILKVDSEAKVDSSDSYVEAYFDIACTKDVKADEDIPAESGTSSQRKTANTKVVADETNSIVFDSEDESRNAMMNQFAGGKA